MSAGSFFEGYRQENASIRGVPAKSPMFYRDVNLMGGVFTASLAEARALLPRGLRPLALPFGRALAAVHCLEFKDSDVGPYNEVSLSIAVRRGPWPTPSLGQAVGALLTQTYHAYVCSLPVTTEVALHGGIDYFNYPKYLADISFRETAAHRVCTLRDRENGDVILEFEGRRLATRCCAPRRANPMTLHTYPVIGGRLHRATMSFNQMERGAAFLRGARLRLGAHPSAEPFRRLRLGPVLHALCVPRGQGILFKPEAV